LHKYQKTANNYKTHLKNLPTT